MADMLTPNTIKLNGPEGLSPVQQPQAPEGVSLVKGIAIILVFTAVLVATGLTVGKVFFWDNYSKGNLLDHELSDNLKKVQGDPTNPANHVSLGWDYFLKGDNERAISEYKQALSIDPKNYAAENNMGLAYMSLKDYDRAVSAFKDAIAITPSTYPPHLNTAICYIKLAKYNDANKELSAAYRVDPGDPETMYWQGVVLEQTGKKKAALGQYLAAINFDPQYKEAKDAYNRLQQQLKK